ncbi:hypothetical protein GCM10020001_026920 [Nonomuraea salmonea]
MAQDGRHGGGRVQEQGGHPGEARGLGGDAELVGHQQRAREIAAEPQALPGLLGGEVVGGHDGEEADRDEQRRGGVGRSRRMAGTRMDRPELGDRDAAPEEDRPLMSIRLASHVINLADRT